MGNGAYHAAGAAIAAGVEEYVSIEGSYTIFGKQPEFSREIHETIICLTFVVLCFDIIKTAPTKKALLDLDLQAQTSLNLDGDYAFKVLRYHTVANGILPSSLVDGEIIETLHGEYVSVSIDGDRMVLNNSTVVLSSHIASNGVVHVIDSVLIPPSLE